MKTTKRGRSRASASALLLATFGFGACGGRDARFDEGFSAETKVLLDGSVALHDGALGEVLFVTSAGPEEVEARAFDLGRNVKAFERSIDGKSLFVLSAGKVPRTRPSDEKPKLQVFSGGTDVRETGSFELDDPMGSLALDPKGEWVAAFAGDATVTNLNEIVLLDLTDEDSRPFPKTIRSFGGSPLEVVFTDVLTVPRGEPRRFVIVRTDRDVTLIDLAHLDREEVTVRLPTDEDMVPYAPAQIVFDDGDPDDPTDARIGIRLAGTSDVMIATLGEPTAEDRDFSVQTNVFDAAAEPSAIDFVRTDGGLRLAALVPSLRAATLFDPDTTLALQVDLGGGYSHMTRITNVTSETPEDGDVALLWGESSRFAFWSLGSTSGTPYRSVDTTELDVTLREVLDVPAPNQHLKVLVGNGASRFYVLDLERRESFPLETDGSGYRISVSSDGERLWAYREGSAEFSAVRFSDLHPAQLYVEPAPSAVFDIARKDGGRAALALSTSDGLGVTWLDAASPDSAETRYFPALHLSPVLASEGAR